MNESVLVFNQPVRSCCGQSVGNCKCGCDRPTPLGLSSRILNYAIPLEEKKGEDVNNGGRAASRLHTSTFNYKAGELPSPTPIHRTFEFPNPLK